MVFLRHSIALKWPPLYYLHHWITVDESWWQIGGSPVTVLYIMYTDWSSKGVDVQDIKVLEGFLV